MEVMTEPQVPSFHSDGVGGDGQDLLIMILDQQAELPSIVRMRSWAAQALAVGPGERALDIGSGTGSEVVALAQAVGPSGSAVGVDPNPAMVEVATARAAGSSARFVSGNAYELPFPDDSFDAVRCERVFQHLDDPAAATAEIARVLRPGGRAILIDSDWATMIMHPIDPEIAAAMSRAQGARTPNLTSGRRLRGLMSAAGFTIDDIGSEAVVFDALASAPMYAAQIDAAVDAGILTRAQADQAAAEMERGIATGDYLFSVTMYAVLGHLA